MVVDVCLVTLLGLFIVGAILNSNITLTFLFISKLRRLISKSPARKKVLSTVVLSERFFFFFKVSHKFKLPSGGPYTTLKIYF